LTGIIDRFPKDFMRLSGTPVPCYDEGTRDLGTSFIEFTP